MVEKLRQMTPSPFSSWIAVTTPALPVVAFAQGKGFPSVLERSAEDTALCTVSSSEWLVPLPFLAMVEVEIELSTVSQRKLCKNRL